MGGLKVAGCKLINGVPYQRPCSMPISYVSIDRIDIDRITCKYMETVTYESTKSYITNVKMETEK